MIRKLNNLFEFFKSTTAINLMVSLIAVLLGGFDYFFVVFLSLGFIMSIVFKEIYRQNDYIFYSNNGFSKTSLWVCSYILTLSLSIFVGLIISLIKKLF
jgi:hypothetical protein